MKKKVVAADLDEEIEVGVIEISDEMKFAGSHVGEYCVNHKYEVIIQKSLPDVEFGIIVQKDKDGYLVVAKVYDNIAYEARTLSAASSTSSDCGSERGAKIGDTVFKLEGVEFPTTATLQ